LLELYQHHYSILHRLDARVKVIFTLAFILSLSLTPPGAWPAYILFFTVILSAVQLSRLGVGFVLTRALLAVPFMLSALPLIFTGPPPLFSIALFGEIQINLSSIGTIRFASIGLKSWMSVQAAILLAATTRFPDMLVALKQLKIPRIFVAIIGLMWRYLLVIVEEVTRMLRARSSRSAVLPGSRHSGGTLFWRGRVTGGMVGSLFLRSLERSDRVYAAMLSRGYNGEPPVFNSASLSARDRKTLILGIATLIILMLLGLITGG